MQAPLPDTLRMAQSMTDAHSKTESLPVFQVNTRSRSRRSELACFESLNDDCKDKAPGRRLGSSGRWYPELSARPLARSIGRAWSGHVMAAALPLAPEGSWDRGNLGQVKPGYR
jgi:hypothetical protein